MVKYAMAIDLDSCTGCRACMIACKVENNTPQAHFWMYTYRFEVGEYPDTRVYFMPRPCQHCDNAPCVKVCPVGARYKRKDGLTVTDTERCIGCRYCQVACPYGVNYFNWKDPAKAQYLDWGTEAAREATGGAVPSYQNPDLDLKYGSEQRHIAGGGHEKGIIGKCTFCVHRIEKGLTTACANICPVNAIKFGDLEDSQSEVSQFLRGKPHFHLLDEVGTKPRVYYVGGSPPGEDTRQIEAIKGEVKV